MTLKEPKIFVKTFSILKQEPSLVQGSFSYGGDGGIRSNKEKLKNTIEIRRSDTLSMFCTRGVPKYKCLIRFKVSNKVSFIVSFELLI